MLSDNFKYSESFIDEKQKTISMLYTASKRMLSKFQKENDPNAVKIMICIKCPIDNINANHADILISPVNIKNKPYNWNRITLPCNEVDAFIKHAYRQN